MTDPAGSTGATVYDVTYGGLRPQMPDVQVDALDRALRALQAACSALEAAGDVRGATPSLVASRAGLSLYDTRVLLGRLVADGLAATRGAGRSTRYVPTPAAAAY